MAGQLVLAETTMEFEYVSAFGAYAHVSNSLPFVFISGHQYTITWDNVEYIRTAFTFEAADGSSCVAVGNPLAAGESSNGDPFAIVCETSNSYLYFISTEATDAHTVSIVLTEGIVLKNRNGEPVAYYGIETVTFDTTTEGKQQTYTKGVAVDGLEIVPDFSGGDMAVIAPDGMLVKSVTIKKPDDLAPENIAEGVDIAGIVGNYKQVKCGIFTGTGGAVTIQHGLGTIPDLIYLFGSNFTNTVTELPYIEYVAGYSYAVYEKKGFGGQRGKQRRYTSATTSTSTDIALNQNGAIDKTSTSYALSNTNENTFNVGGTSLVTHPTAKYIWIAAKFLI